MNRLITLMAAALVTLAAAVLTVQGAPVAPAASAVELNTLLSRLQAMGQGYHTQTEWDGVFRDLEQMAARAEQAQAWEQLVEVNQVKALVFGQMLRDYPRALDVLKNILAQYGPRCPKKMAGVYARMADCYARLGDEAAVSRLIKEFKASPYYDPEQYPFTGGWGREVPLAVTRAAAKGANSISVTAMERQRKLAKLGPGQLFPDFQATDLQGKAVRLADYRGRVVLVDCWARAWEPWQRALPAQAAMFKRYHSQGFDIIGINLEIQPAGLESFAQAHNMPWPQIANDPALTKKLGIFGDATNFLLDRNGVILARDLQVAELVKAVQDALPSQ
ncbi:MAG: peroxiredoxin family protein [Kiritimatiellaeota bacterium]|nr:peroxiredoxin family protein [Kiritimatiellota bacterium]